MLSACAWPHKVVVRGAIGGVNDTLFELDERIVLYFERVVAKTSLPDCFATTAGPVAGSEATSRCHCRRVHHLRFELGGISGVVLKSYYSLLI